MKSKNRGGIAIIILCSILILLSLVVLIISPVAGALGVLGGIAGIIYGAKARKRYKAEIQAAEEKRIAVEAAAKEAAAKRAAECAAKEAAEKEAAERREKEKTEREATRGESSVQFALKLESIPRVEVATSSAKVNRRQPTDMPPVSLSNITVRTHLDKLFPLVVIDTETTGTTPRGNDIIEVSAVRFENGFIPVSCFTTLCKARNPIPPAAAAVNHITDEMIADKPYFWEVAASLSEYLKGCNIVAHNMDFDRKFLFCCGCELPEDVKYFDTLDLAKRVLTCPSSKKWDNEIKAKIPVDNYDVENYKLDTLCEYYGIYRNDAHRALSDAYATGLLFEKLVQEKRS